MSQLHNAFTLFISLLVEAIPFLLLGVLLSSSLLLLVDERKLITKLPKNPLLGAIAGSCIGFLFPVCECGNVPVARRLLLKGVSPAVAVAFLLAAPTINPVVIWSTWVAFGGQPQIVFLRIVFSLIIAIAIGCLFSVQKDVKGLLQPRLIKRLNFLENQQQNLQSSPQEKVEVPALLQSGSFLLGESAQPLVMNEALLVEKPQLQSRKVSKQKWQQFIDNVLQELQELGGMLVLGSAIAATIQVFVPREVVFSLGQDNITSILAMMLLAAIVSICSTVDSFFALSFVSTFTSGSILAFLVFGPTIDIKALGLMLSIFKPKIIIYLFAIIAQLVFLMTFVYSYFF
ncbi:putative permease [Hyella patelloides LEGE 07179]|uniref:Putative permease n=1 Tax=Hyella patelloides LEGE 07179 TaxID=945734 RepID=A0A563VUF4_9CYAN|nr:permease [Hyella patelloides]VEP15102.1 putative permease [Hyella patelloides LEGE 07179]